MRTAAPLLALCAIASPLAAQSDVVISEINFSQQPGSMENPVDRALQPQRQPRRREQLVGLPRDQDPVRARCLLVAVPGQHLDPGQQFLAHSLA